MSLQTNLWVGIILATIHSVLSEYCQKDTCEYNFDVRRRRSMTFIADDGNMYDVKATSEGLQPTVSTFRVQDLLPNGTVDPDIVPIADGKKRNLITINDQYPGPTIEVKEGAKVIVNVCNYMFTEGLSIHWHGLYQRGTQRYDGVAFVTQCPVPAGTCFQYWFYAIPHGTRWYHAHFSNQRADGLYGMLIVHRDKPRIQSFNVMVQDLPADDAMTREITNPLRPDEKQPGSGENWMWFPTRDKGVDGISHGWAPNPVGIINGRGRRDNPYIPLTLYTVKSGDMYIMRIVHAGAHYGYEISIDDHEFNVVASDGYEIVPILVHSVYIQPGETHDIQIVANQPIGRYWVRAETQKFDETGSNGKLGFAIFEYEGATGSGDPTTQERVCTADNPCKVFNCHFKGFADHDHRICYDFNDAKSTLSTEELDHEFGILDEACEEHFSIVATAAGVNINNKRYDTPRSSLLQENYKDFITPCDDLDCSEGCICTQLVDLPYGKTIQLVMSNRAGIFAPHPMHLHGHGFAVLKQEFAEYDPITGLNAGPNDDIDCGIPPEGPPVGYCLDPKWREGHPTGLNQVNPPIKDTIVLPSMGYVVVRFKADNPGMWLFHCHLDTHFNDGMVFVFREAADKIQPLPKGFPVCGDYKEEIDEGYGRGHKHSHKNKS